MIKYLIVCPLVFIAGFIDAIAGGGGLISLPAYLLTGMPVHNCLATNKMSSFMGTSVATAKYARNGFIPWRYAIFAIPCAVIGSTLGANLALHIDDGTFKIIMLFVIPLTAIYVLFKKEIKPSGEELSKGVTTALCMLMAFCIGIYDGFYGPGTGTFLILLLTGVVNMKLDKANGITKAINFTTNLSALTVYLINAQVVFPLGLIAGLFNILGNYLGALKFEKDGSKVVKPVIIIVLLLFMVKVISEL